MLTICHPGRYGDLLWALPTVRALSEQSGEPVHMALPTDPANTTPMDRIVPLLTGQPYIGAVEVMGGWSIIQDAPRAPRVPARYEGKPNVVGLGYTSWPHRALPYCAAELGGVVDAAGQDPDHFFRPWITAPRLDHERHDPRPRIAVHWTDRYFELKLGILHELRRTLPEVRVDWYAEPGSRMQDAGAWGTTFYTLAQLFAGMQVVLTDCSAAHVMAAALGVPHVLVVEPEEARHHWVFWPGTHIHDDGLARHWQQKPDLLGRTIRPVLGGDGRPTFDSRHTVDAIKEALDAH